MLYKQTSTSDAQGFGGYAGGHGVLWGAQLELFRSLDAMFCSWAAECGADEYQFPPVIPAHELNKIGYFKAFPHHLTLPVRLSADNEQLREFSSRDALDETGALRLIGCMPVRDVLTPAACYHFYINFQGEVLQRVRYVTTRATCFRGESHYVPLYRQWSFSMREIVCLGTATEVTEFLDRYRQKLERFFRTIDLPVRFQPATDPFFHPEGNPRYIAQKLDPVKTEMVFGDDLAIGSINFHRSYFGETFRIQRAGEDAFSGCVAFGIERWIRALLSRFGDDERRWPDLHRGVLE